MKAKKLLVAGTLAAALGVLPGGPAAAASPWRVTAVGLGSATAQGSAGHDYSGSLSGSPFGGSFSGAFAADDGALPALGECEPASATLTVEDERGRFYTLASTGEVCAWFLPLGTMHQYTGRWTVASTNVKKLVRASGHADFRVLNGQSDIYATQG